VLKNNYDYIAIKSNTSIPSLKTIHLNLFCSLHFCCS